MNDAVIADNNPMSYEISIGLNEAVGDYTHDERATDRIISGKDGDWVVHNGDDNYVSPDLTDPIERIEYQLSGGKNIWERMEDYGVPGISIAVIDGNEVVYARGYGEQSRMKPEPILARTPFDVASLSKFVGALSVLAQLEKEGSIDLDDVQLHVRQPHAGPGPADLLQRRRRHRQLGHAGVHQRDPRRLPRLRQLTFRLLMT